MINSCDHLFCLKSTVNKSVNKFVNNMENTVSIDTNNSYSQNQASYSQPYLQGLYNVNNDTTGNKVCLNIFTAPYYYLLIQITLIIFYVFIEEPAWN